MLVPSPTPLPLPDARALAPGAPGGAERTCEPVVKWASSSLRLPGVSVLRQGWIKVTQAMRSACSPPQSQAGDVGGSRGPFAAKLIAPRAGQLLDVRLRAEFGETVYVHSPNFQERTLPFLRSGPHCLLRASWTASRTRNAWMRGWVGVPGSTKPATESVDTLPGSRSISKPCRTKLAVHNFDALL